ncbi:MAG: hypothetical protein GX541_07570, partial [Clostridiales bacterium]|nr:hypothetical protein [Clostridiales bacterium]
MGKMTDPIWSCYLAADYSAAYDAFFPMYDDPKVISFLTDKAKKVHSDNPKDTARSIRANIEDNLLREIYQDVIYLRVCGNFGMAKRALATAAISLDSVPETGRWLEWIAKPGPDPVTGRGPENQVTPRSGGNLFPKLLTGVKRDGMGGEGAPGYNKLWLEQTIDMAEVMARYDKSPFNLYENPRFTKMFSAFIPLTLGGYYTAQIGDSGRTAGSGQMPGLDYLVRGFVYSRSPVLAQEIYHLNPELKDLITDLSIEADPEQLKKDILSIIKTHGEKKNENDMMAGWGFAVLRDGIRIEDENEKPLVNTITDFGLSFVGAYGHKHSDVNNLFIDAFGLNMSPDFGYPELTGAHPHTTQWVFSTLSHNSVMVNGQSQTAVQTPGRPLHFADMGTRARVLDVDGAHTYFSADEGIYRRTVVMVKVDEDVSYGVDFFRVKGGNDHIYSFHSQSEKISEVENLNPEPQTDGDGNYIGSYAGENIPWGDAAQGLQAPHGSTWLDEVRRDSSPPREFAVDFEIKDYLRVLDDSKGLRLRMTMLNDFDLSELALAKGTPPRVKNNEAAGISKFEYVLARRKGRNLDSLFTAVYEPYRNTRYLQKIEQVKIEAVEGRLGPNDAAKAVRIEHAGGHRVDYIVYSTNRDILFNVDNGAFNFRGFIGVYTKVDGKGVYTALHDGELLDTFTADMPRVTGKVMDFTKELTLENSITVLPEQDIDPSQLAGKYIFIDTRPSPQNGVYKILGATPGTGGEIVLDIGDVSPVANFKDTSNIYGGYTYSISTGMSFEIPLSNVLNPEPVFKPIEDKAVDANSEIRFTVSAESPAGKDLTYSAKLLPRGATFDPDTKTVTWRPENSQKGIHVVAIKATDGELTNIQYIKVTVHSGTINKKPPVENGGGGGQQGGGQTSP